MPKIIKNDLGNFLVIYLSAKVFRLARLIFGKNLLGRKIWAGLIIFLIVTGWVFSGWPQIWKNPPIPPAVPEARADTEIRRPTSHTDSAGKTTDPANAYDAANGTTFSTTLYNVTNTSSITFHTWQTTAYSYTATYLKVRYHADAGTDDKYGIAYSTTGCTGTFTYLVALTSSGAADTTVSSSNLGASPDLSQFCVKIETVKTAGPDNKNVYIRNIWTEGTYTPPPDLTWNTGAADFKIYQSSSLTWGAGTLICSGTLIDDNTQTISCTTGSIANSTQYRVQVILKNVGSGVANMQGASEYVDHKFVKAGWAGTSPTLGSCGFYDVSTDDGATTCSAAWNATNDVRITNTGAGNVVIAATSGTEGFMYLITTGSDVPSSNSTSYMDASIDSITEDSSKITISGPAPPAPTLSFSIDVPSDLKIGFGTWSGTEIRYPTDDETGTTSVPGVNLPIKLQASTNAANGLTITVRSQGDGTNAGLYKSVSPTKRIAAVASSAVTADNEGYGVYGKNASLLTIDEGFNNDTISDLAVSTTTQRLAYALAAVSSGTVDVVPLAAITGNTPAGSYSDALTFICTGIF